MAIIKNSIVEDEEKGYILHCLWECARVHPGWKTVLSSLKKLKVELQYDPKIPFLGIYPRDVKSLSLD